MRKEQMGMARIAKVFCLLIWSFPMLSRACSPGPDWKPLTPELAFRNADVVIHARVIQQVNVEGTVKTPDGRKYTVKNSGAVNAKIEILSVLKGSFAGDFVTTGRDAMCGVGGFVDGKEYVFFLDKEDTFVNDLRQPWHVTTRQTLDAIEQLRK